MTRVLLVEDEPDLADPLAYLLRREGYDVEVAEDGWPALVAAGKLHYLGGWPDEVALARILQRACASEGIECDTLPEGLRRRDTATHRVLFNYNPVPAEWGGVTIPPAGVHWVAK